MRQPAKALSQWFQQHQRPMPWRKTRNPYSIWISEVMLQQTQVATVIPYFERFLSRFPTVEALAQAPEADVLAHWSGLGYYSRARNLHRGAKCLVDNHGGKFPPARETLLEVPGIGPYTAGAILSIAFDLPEALVDGNVQRVLSRYHGWKETIESTASKHFFWEQAAAWVRAAESPRILNQGLMELGATVCTKGTPRCARCPLSKGCAAHQLGLEAELPVRRARREKVDVLWLGLVFEYQGQCFVRPNPEKEWWSGLWDFPRVAVDKPSALESATLQLGKVWKTKPYALGTQRHTVTHHRLNVVPVVLPVKAKPRNLGEGRWVSAEELIRLPISSLAKKIARAWGSELA